MTERTQTDRALIDIVEQGFEGWNQRDYEKIAGRVGDDYVFESDARRWRSEIRGVMSDE